MASHLVTVDGPPSDGELISLVRAGETDAYGELFSRHVLAARRLARQLVSAGEVDDLVSEAFAKVLVVLQRGGGPDLAFRAYLLTAVRRLHVDRIRVGARLHTTADLTPFDPGVPFRDTAVEGFENAAAARAFGSLPERWQLVLWHTEVEGQKPAEVATLLGMSPNSVSALAYRAREGLRQAYLSMHAQDVDDDACARTRANLGAYVRGGLSRRDSARVEEHLEECRQCAAIYLELTEVNSRLGALLAPLLLGAAASAYLASAAGGGTAVAGGGVVALLDRARDAVMAHGPTAAIAGAAASAVAAGLLLTLHQGAGNVPAAEDLPSAQASPSLGASTAPVHRDRSGPGPAGSRDRSVTADEPGPGPGYAAPTAGPSGPPTAPPTVPPSGSPSAPPPTSPPPTHPPSAPPQSPLVQLDVDVSVGPGGIGASVGGGVLGQQLPTIGATVPVP
ncbi:sigma-70 family RNA polymerase sigma factor [Nocardioides sp. URHA0032]|uniref:sigma-70 family RNA polymerase sigma factor n=1 Tax=Nocardioides sp. URHA0032 TaxID=1380388 RepID=UPI00068627F6|nr:sigma-70 family RNA polymerase sigma factor [Nocardioides sp. URHA0032]